MLFDNCPGRHHMWLIGHLMCSWVAVISIDQVEVSIIHYNKLIISVSSVHVNGIFLED